MTTPRVRRVVVACILSVACAGTAVAQRIEARRSAFTAASLSQAYGRHANEGAAAAIDTGARPDLRQHALYGAMGGVALWAVYFVLPTEPDAPRGERVLVLPAAVLTGAAVGFVTGILRRAL